MGSRTGHRTPPVHSNLKVIWMFYGYFCMFYTTQNDPYWVCFILWEDSCQCDLSFTSEESEGEGQGGTVTSLSITCSAISSGVWKSGWQLGITERATWPSWQCLRSAAVRGRYSVQYLPQTVSSLVSHSLTHPTPTLLLFLCKKLWKRGIVQCVCMVRRWAAAASNIVHR